MLLNENEPNLRQDLQNNLSSQIDKLLVPFLKNKSEHICIIDPPGHPNVGDSAILLGELNFLKNNFPNAKLSFYDVRSYSTKADSFIDEATILLIHGGGNFGDIWPHHQDLRMRILERFSHKTIVQLPQSIYFSDKANLRVTAAAIKEQSGFTLFVRDLNSFHYARKHFDCEVILAPDMAFAMPTIIRNPSSVEYLCLLRTDKEVVTNHQQILDTFLQNDRTFDVCDWIAQPKYLTAQLDAKLGSVTRRAPAVTAPLRSMTMRLRQHYAMQRLVYGIDLLSKGAVVVTDRLHAHILCCLLNIPHFVFDSLGGKISAFHQTWTRDDAGTELVASAAEFSRKWNKIPLSTKSSLTKH